MIKHPVPLLFASLLVGLVTPARADPDSAAQIDTTPLARRLFNEGVDAARRFDWAAALERFAKSYDLAPRPLTLYNLAGAQVATNRLIRGIESYRRFLRDTSDGSYADFRKEAQSVLVTLEPKMAWVKLTVPNLGHGDQLVLDGQPIVQAVLEESMPIDPGKHVLVVKRTSAPDAHEDFIMIEGGSKTVTLELPEAHRVAPVEPVKLTGTVPIREPLQRALTPRAPTESHWYQSGLLWTVVTGSAIAIGGGTYLYLHSRPFDSTLGAVDVNGRATP